MATSDIPADKTYIYIYFFLKYPTIHLIYNSVSWVSKKKRFSVSYKGFYVNIKTKRSKINEYYTHFFFVFPGVSLWINWFIKFSAWCRLGLFYVTIRSCQTECIMIIIRIIFRQRHPFFLVRPSAYYNSTSDLINGYFTTSPVCECVVSFLPI